MAKIQIVHNPRCSKSRQTLALLTDKQIEHEVLLYLKSPLNLATLEEIKLALGVSSFKDMMRTKEALYKELALNDASEEKLGEALLEHPKLIERPIVVVRSDKHIHARIGRPPEQVLDILP
ncbi:arsenate reductase (glutaredoxin) [Alteromonas sp. 5E99-2]|uniref:arsenate reductase (glutaredoxin) n=1 Tax=Alteromonas sp. 5E99-2 TaxID=2817683 RepID=UPI001A99F6CC|nr:arsenate reductase (glutaredoxin) [Alteromonas sp. 5E99-2]MBO1255563.1 arsenate reductase (glutaredoxin) [Alteromonas sp. 5E99-2]